MGALKSRLSLSINVKRLVNGLPSSLIKREGSKCLRPITITVSFTFHNQTVYIGSHWIGLIDDLAVVSGSLLHFWSLFQRCPHSPLIMSLKLGRLFFVSECEGMVCSSSCFLACSLLGPQPVHHSAEFRRTCFTVPFPGIIRPHFHIADQTRTKRS